jgi:hypothetical protein
VYEAAETGIAHKENGAQWMVYGMDETSEFLSGWEESENGAWLAVQGSKAGKHSAQVVW